MREARIHVRHIRDLLKSLDPSDAFNGVDCNSLSFLSVFTEGDLGGTGQKGSSVVVSVLIPRLHASLKCIVTISFPHDPGVQRNTWSSYAFCFES